MTDATRGKTLVLALTDQDHERLQTWQPCTRVRLVPVDDDTARLEVDTRSICQHCKGAGIWDGMGFKARCRHCRGTGLR